MSAIIPEPQEPESIIISYMTLRKIIGFMGIFLVPVLIVGNWILQHTMQIEISVSAYYWTGMGNVLEGTICGIALFLLSYHGYSWQDSLASKLSGLFGLGIALFPTSHTGSKDDISSIVHYITAGIFFIILSYMSIFLFTKSTAEFMTPQKKERNGVYRICGIVMLVSVAVIPLSLIPDFKAHFGYLKPTLIFETIALSSFGFSWLTKGEFLLKDK